MYPCQGIADTHCNNTSGEIDPAVSTNRVANAVVLLAEDESCHSSSTNEE